MGGMKWLLAALAALLATIHAAQQPAPQQPNGNQPPAPVKGSHVHLVVSHNFPDPGFMKAGDGRYYLYGTGAGFRVTSSVSPNGGFGTPKTSMPKDPAWVGNATGGRPHLWAPHVFEVRTGATVSYTMYFSGYDKQHKNNCIGAATASAPTGPFVADPKPMICSARAGYAVIDPTMYLAGDGQRYIVFKHKIDLGKGNVHYEIRAAKVNHSGRALVGTASTVLASSTTAGMEAPSVVEHGGKLWLFVARNDYAGCGYATQVWSARSLLGKWTPVRTLPIRDPKTGRAFCGPGGTEVINDGGVVRAAFHVWQNFTPKSGSRVTWSGEIRWTSKGVPYLY